MVGRGILAQQAPSAATRAAAQGSPHMRARRCRDHALMRCGSRFRRVRLRLRRARMALCRLSDLAGTAAEVDASVSE